MRTPKLRWLHCSDLHFGKDRTAQERLLGRIVAHVADRVSRGFVPDLVFVTGDPADKGLGKEYDGLRKEFVDPVREALGGGNWPGRRGRDQYRLTLEGRPRRRASAPGVRARRVGVEPDR